MYVQPKSDDAYPLWIRILFWLQKQTTGQVYMPLMIWGRRPWALFYFLLFYSWLDRKGSPLEPALRSLIQVRVSQINHCVFCIDLNAATLLKRGVSNEKLAELAEFRNSKLFTNKERLCLELTEQITYTDKTVMNQTASDLKELIGDDAFVELNALIAFQNLSSKFNASLNIPSQGLCRL